MPCSRRGCSEPRGSSAASSPLNGLRPGTPPPPASAPAGRPCIPPDGSSAGSPVVGVPSSYLGRTLLREARTPAGSRHALKLAPKKLQSSLAVGGEGRKGGLVAFGDDGDDLILALARKVASGEEYNAENVEALFAQVGRQGQRLGAPDGRRWRIVVEPGEHHCRRDSIL